MKYIKLFDEVRFENFTSILNEKENFSDEDANEIIRLAFKFPKNNRDFESDELTELEFLLAQKDISIIDFYFNNKDVRYMLKDDQLTFHAKYTYLLSKNNKIEICSAEDDYYDGLLTVFKLRKELAKFVFKNFQSESGSVESWKELWNGEA